MKLVKNIAVLLLWQASLYLVPLLTVPYLSRTLGVVEFGRLGVAQNLVNYAYVVIGWGFGISATQMVARNADDPATLREIFWDTLWAQAAIGLAVIALLAGLTLLIPSMHALSWLLLGASLQAVSSMFSVYWFLQGLERMGGFAIASLFGRLTTLPLTFAFVKGPDDVAVAAAIAGGTFLLSAAASLSIAGRAAPLLPIRFSPSGARRQIIEGSRLFLSTGVIRLFLMQSSVAILGTIAGMVQAGLFLGAERIRWAAQRVFEPIVTAAFPRVNNLMVRAPHRAATLMMMLVIGQGALTGALSIGLMIAARPITIGFLGPEFEDAVPIMQWLAVLPFVVCLGNVLGRTVMLPLGMRREFSHITMAGGMLNIVTIVPLCHLLGGVGAALATVVTESWITAAIAVTIFLRRDVVRPQLVPA